MFFTYVVVFNLHQQPCEAGNSFHMFSVSKLRIRREIDTLARLLSQDQNSKWFLKEDRKDVGDGR